MTTREFPERPARSAGARRLQRWREGGIGVLLRACAFASVAGLVLIMVFVFREALPVLHDPEVMKEASLARFFATPIWQPVGDVPKYGLLPLIGGTLKVVLVAMLFAVPLGIFAAIFASEFASNRVREFLKPAIEVLAGIPSVVLGFFALMVMASWLQAVTGAESRLNALNAGIALGLGVLPTLFTVCEDALRAVPKSYREGALALGASRWQTAWSVTLPAASAGVSAGILLALARAVGETMIVLMASGNASIVSGSVFDSVRTLSASIAAELAEVVVGSAHYSTLFFLGALLFTTTFLINVAAGAMTARLRRRLVGALAAGLAPAAPTPRTLARLRAARRDHAGGALTGLTGFAAFLIVAMVALIVGNIVWFGWRTVTWNFLTAVPREGMTAGGIFPAIFGTVALVLLMVVVLIPIGVGAAIYLHEYARPDSWFTRSVRFAVNNLAGVPSIVFGLFGLGFFIQFVGHSMDRAMGLDVVWGQPALIWAALTLALLNLPVVIVTTEEAFRTVPREMREASLALGASRWQTVRYVLLPQAMPGILTGAILSVARGAGEVAPILFTGAAYFLPYLPTSPTDQFMELGYHVFVMATQSPDVDATRPILYGTVLVLLLITFLLNLTAIVIRARLRARLAGRG